MDSPFPKNNLELSDIFREFVPLYRKINNLPLGHIKTIKAITDCRTKGLGGHKEKCDNPNCDGVKISYNSCRNRHCPKCGCFNKEKWLLKRKSELLAVPYFHVVLTISDLLNPIVVYNDELIYNILFISAKETLITLAKDKKHLGADIGFMAILHTWGQILSRHPHLHAIVTCGGLSFDKEKWIYPKKSKKKRNFFVHVDVISDLFKKRFLHYLNQSYKNGKLNLKGNISYLKDDKNFKAWINKLYSQKWITYCKSPFKSPELVFEYICRYTHRVAISNNRIVKVEDNKVFFQWRDYRDCNKTKIMKLDIFEFIRRFLMHVLPNNFYKIRYYGIWSSRQKKRTLEKCQDILGQVNSHISFNIDKLTMNEWYRDVTGIDLKKCQKCNKGRMILVEVIPAIREGPI